ncbi:MAG TPA: FkbM family methyltransferase [Xanthomonadaceae bacterium]|jgi:FkbM family methyltransferase|nr:FkbM family methyltransferase [Xanthomonadaceae bacterium]
MNASGKLAKLRKLWLILGNRNYLKALKSGAAAGVEHARVIGNLACATVVDIGANRGQFALVARRCFPTAAIFSFEPLQRPADIFRRVFAGDTHAELFQSAIGPNSGAATIHVSQRDDSSSLLSITDKQNELFPGTAEQKTETIKVGRLGDFLRRESIKRPALLKLDVQGFELSALKGSEELLEEFSWIYVECSFVELYEGQALADEVIDWLRARGFPLDGVYNMAYDAHGRAIQADFLFKAISRSQA